LRRSLALLLVLAAALAAALASAAPASAAFTCDASAVRGQLLGGPVVEPVTANRGAAECRAARASGGVLPAPVTSVLSFAETTLAGAAGAAAGQVAGATGGIADVRIGPLATLPVELPTLQAIEAVPPVATPLGTVDLRPQLRVLAGGLQSLDVLRLRTAVSDASGRCDGGAARLDGTSRVAGLSVLGLELPTDRAVTETIQVLGGGTISPSQFDLGALLPGVTLTPALESTIRGLLPTIQLPASVAEVRVTPGSTTRTGDRLVQRALGVAISIGERSVADLTFGEASVGATDVACGSVATAALQCTTRRLVLIDVLPGRRRVQLVGAADRRYIGRTVNIFFNATGRRVARARVRQDGTFRTTAAMPPRRFRGTNGARYQARIGRQRSLRLKLQRRMIVRSLRLSGGVVRIAGRVTGPLATPVRTIEVRRRQSCRRWVVVKRIRPNRRGEFSTTVAAPASQLAATYRFATRVRKTTSNPKTYPTFTLPRHVDLGRS
jgi:hypothetical protein